jgi:hypothetical protein
MERKTKGVDLMRIVASLRAIRKTQELPAISDQAQVYLNQRILPSVWYPYEVFRELGGIMHQLFAGGTDEGAKQMGVLSAQVLKEQHVVFLRDDPRQFLGILQAIWTSHFNFGRVEVPIIREQEAQVVLLGYEDMPRWHGILTMAWMARALELSGAKNVQFTPIAAPWEPGHTELRFNLTWS